MTAENAHGHHCGRTSTTPMAAPCSATEARIRGEGRQGRDCGRSMPEILPRAGAHGERALSVNASAVARLSCEPDIEKPVPERPPGEPVVPPRHHIDTV